MISNIEFEGKTYSFDYDKSDTERQLEAVANIHDHNTAGTISPNNAALTLQVLNNVFKAFNTVADLNNSQIEEVPDVINSESQINKPINTGENRDNVDTYEPKECTVPVSNPIQDNNTTTSGAGIESSSTEPKKNAESSKNYESTQATCSNTSTHDLMKQIERKLWFFSPISDEDDRKIENIKHLKEQLCVFGSIDDLLLEVIHFIENGNSMDSEVFFLLINTYCLPRPERYHDMFRRNIFSTKPFCGGKGEIIDSFLSNVR